MSLIYAYNPSGARSVRPHAVASVGGQAYTYDTSGNLTSGGVRTLTWDSLNQLTSISATSSVAGGYLYDADGVRVRRATNVPQPSGMTTAYIAGLWEEDLGVVWRALYTFAGRVIAQRDTAMTVTYLHADQLGSVSAATNSSGAVVASQAYSPFGSVRTGGGLPTTQDFTGQHKDATGLLDLRCALLRPGAGALPQCRQPGAGRQGHDSLPEARHTSRRRQRSGSPSLGAPPCTREDERGGGPSVVPSRQQASGSDGRA